MASYEGHLEVQITDINGDVAQVRMPVAFADTKTLAQINTEVGTFATNVGAVSNGLVTLKGFSVKFAEAAYVVGVSPPANTEYSSVTDGARLQFADTAGGRSSITIPAPLESMFGTASNVVNPLDANTALLIAFFAANAGSLSGLNYTLYKGGIKVGRRARRRRSALIP